MLMLNCCQESLGKLFRCLIKMMSCALEARFIILNDSLCVAQITIINYPNIRQGLEKLPREGYEVMSSTLTLR